MKPRDELKRLRIIIYVSWGLLLLIAILLAVATTYYTRNFKSILTIVSENGKTVIKGIDGQNGINGVNGESLRGPIGDTGPKGDKGDKGDTGAEGKTTIFQQDTIFTNNQPVPGEKGDKGEAGKDAKSQIIEINYETCQLTSRYADDDSVQVLAQLPKPCKPESEDAT